MQPNEIHDPAIGTVIDDKYRIDSLIGQGGMGKVFRVTHLQLNKTFALKLIGAVNAKRLLRFKREAEALAKINHPNVVMVTDFGVTPDDHPYIVMEYIEGVTLYRFCKTEGKVSEKQIVHIGKQICAGLYEAHLQGIIHRDLKPANIMIQRLSDGEIMARVLDFGLAKSIEQENRIDLTDDKETPGTLRYMAPEQIAALPVDERSDIFSLCLTLYEVLTGAVPHVVVSKAQPVCSFRPDISSGLSDIILKGLSQSPEDRQQNILELKRELESIETQASSNNQKRSSDDSQQQSDVNTEPARAITFENQHATLHSPYVAVAVGSSNYEQNARRADRFRRRFYWSIVFVILVLLTVSAGWRVYIDIRKAFGYDSVKTDKISEIALPQLIDVKGDKFIMGSNAGDRYTRPEHEVLLKGFKASKSLVTNRQYAEFVMKTGRNAPMHWNGKTPPPSILEKPITNVSWDDATEYCIWLTNQTGKNFRLITEEEWEYLARNRERIGVEEIVGDYCEWTSSKFSLYPGSQLKDDPAIKENALKMINEYILRGRCSGDYIAGNDPVIFRTWEFPNSRNPMLSFRIASD